MSKKYLYKIELYDDSCVIVTNIRTKQHGCVITTNDANSITTRRYNVYGNNIDYSCDLKSIPAYIIDEAIELLKTVN